MVFSTMALIGSLETVAGQLGDWARFASAVAYLGRVLDPTSVEARRIAGIAEGVTERVELGDGVFALEQVYQSKPAAEGKFEAHARLIDLQAIVAGEERMEVSDVRHLVETENFLAERDVRFFAEPGVAVSQWIVRAGEVAVFFPVDGHKPSLAIAQPTLVRKTVVKVPVAAE